MQGDCTWTDGVPYVYSYWLPDHLYHNLVQYQIFKEGKLIYNYNTSMHQMRRTPEDTNFALCVAFGLLPDDSLSHWMPISCNKSYEASFFCTSNINYANISAYLQNSATQKFDNMMQQLDNSTSTNVTQLMCPDGWIMINNLCFYSYTVASDITFAEAEATCNTVDAKLPIISKPYLGHSTSYESSDKFTVVPPKMSLFEIMDKFNVEIGAPSTATFTKFATKYQENMVGFRLMATSENTNLVILLNILRKLLHFLSSSMFRGPRGECFTLEFDEELSDLLPDIHTIYGNSVPGWMMVERKCSSKLYILPLLCTKAAMSRNIECAPNHYRCGDASCILDIYRCDKFSDCQFSEDEQNCSQSIQQMIPCFSSGTAYSENMIPFHDLCDGIKQCPNGTDESFCLHNQTPYVLQYNEETSDKSRHLKRQKILEKQSVSKWESTLDYMMSLFIARLKSRVSVREMYHINISSSPLSRDKWWSFYLSCSLSENAFIVDDLCKHSLRINTGAQCGMGVHLQHCQNVACSGMFKCKNSHCIEIDNVCDGKQDCIGGEDEMLCFNLSCPGMLKCRGLTRCVPPWKLCDGYIHCAITMDDEVGCKRCPEHCKCDNRAFICETPAPTSIRAKDMHLNSTSTVIYLAATDLKVTNYMMNIQKCIKCTILHPNCISIIRLDISDCHLRNMDNVIFSHHQQIVFLNASHNILSTLNFLTENIKLQLRDVDVSYNTINSIITPKMYNSKSLELLRLNNNKISNIDSHFLDIFTNIRMLDIRKNPVYYISSRVIQTLSSLSVLYVSDKHICCIFQIKVGCHTNLDNHALTEVKLNFQTCQGFSVNPHVRLFIQLFLSMCILINLSSIVFNVTHVKFNNTKLAVTLLNLNISLSGTISILYVISVFLVNMKTENRPSAYSKDVNDDISCICKKLFCLVALQMDVYLLIIKSYSIYSRVKYPYRHQCIWLKYTNIVCILFWVYTIGNCTILIKIYYSESYVVSFVKTCYILAESKTNSMFVRLMSLAFGLLYLITLVIYICLIFNFQHILRQSMSALKHARSNSKTDFIITRNTICMTSVESVLLLAVSLTLLVPCSVQFPQMFYSYYVLEFVLTIKTLLKDLLHSLYPALGQWKREQIYSNIVG